MIVKHNGEIVPDQVRKKSQMGIILFIMFFVYLLMLGYGIKNIRELLLAEAKVLDIILMIVFWVGYAIFVISAMWLWYDRHWAKFEIDYKGVWTKYPLRAKKLISWDHFQEVCICYEMCPPKSSIRAYVMICFVKNGTKKNYKGQWKLDGLFSYKKIISLDYTEELHKRLQQICPLDVIDLRDTPEYKLF